ncbi:MAG: PAS domain S-box protein [Dehalococcoidia bacterium]|nr:PAS domain S-box protein [Dehalococcoidia bacterium]
MMTTPDIPADASQQGANLDPLRLSEEARRDRVGIDVVDSMPALVVVMDARGEFRYISEAYRHYTGLTLAQARDWEHYQVIHPDDYAAAMERWQAVMKRGDPFSSDMRLRRADGAYRWHRVCGMAMRNPDDTIARWITVSIDIDDAKRADHRLQLTAELYRMLAEALPAVLLTASPDGALTYANRRFYEYTGLLGSEPLDAAWAEVTHPDDRARIAARWAEARRDGQEFEDEYRVRGADGIYRWHAARTVPVRGGGDIAIWIATLADIHDRRRAEDDERFLLAASSRLAQSLDYDETLDVITSLVVPRLADWCGIFARDGQDPVRRVASAYNDARYGDWDIAAPRAPSPGIAHVLATGEPWLNSDLSAETMRARGVPEPYITESVAAGFRSSMLLPLKSRGQTTGVIVLCAVADRRYDERDLRVAGEFAARASAALDSASLYRESRRAEQAQAEAFSLLDATFATAPIGLAFIDAGLRIRRINQTLAEMNGGRIEETLGQRVPDVVPQLWAELEPAYRRVLDRAEPITDLQISGESAADPGRRRSWRVSLYPVRAADGAVSGVGVIVVDVTDEHEQQERQRLSELRYRTLANTVPELIWAARPDGRIDYFNDRWHEYTGPRPSGERAVRWRSVVHPEDLEAVSERWERCLRTGEDFTIEARLRRHDGVYRWHAVHAVALTRIDGSVISWFGSCADTEERRRQEEELRVSELRYRTLAESLPQIVWSTHADGSPEFRSESWFTYTGERREDLSASGWREYIHPDDREDAWRAWEESLATGAPYEAEFRLRARDGTYRWHTARSRPVRMGDAISGWFGTLSDVHDRNQESVRQSFLAHASNILSTSLDYHETLASVARLAVPEIGDWCAVDVLEDGRLERLAVTHIDPAKIRWAYELEEKYPPNPEDANGVYEVVRTGVAQLWPEIPEELLVQGAVDEEHLRVIREIGFTSAMVVPITAAGETLGAITLVTAESNRRYGAGDLALAEELGRRSGNAIARARLYAAEQDAREAAERATQRAALLAETSELLGRSLNYDKNLRDLATLMAPALADWCTVDVIEDGQLRRLAITNADRSREEQLRAFDERYTLDIERGSGSAQVARTGAPIHVSRVSDEMLAATAADADQLALLRQADIVSYSCVPLVARGRTLGAMALFTLRGESGRRLRMADFALAEEVGRRAGIAIDNARLFAEAQRTAAELRLAVQAKDEFLGLVSHELRTPITTIFGNAQVLHYRGARLDSETRDRAIADIEQESERLHRIIDNMLVLSRLEAGRTLQTEPVVVPRMIERVVGGFRQRQPRRQVEVEVEEGLPPVSAEPVYFEQVLRNLLSNAGKYSPPSEQVLVQASREDGCVAVRVLDQGPGIPEDEMSQIFRAFYRSPRTSAQAPGAGIGLAVCKRLIEAQGGRIWARPREHGGAEFGFTLPEEVEETKS